MFESPRGRGNEGKVVSWLTILPLFLPESGEWKEDPGNQRAAQIQLTVLAEIAVSANKLLFSANHPQKAPS